MARPRFLTLFRSRSPPRWVLSLWESPDGVASGPAGQHRTRQPGRTKSMRSMPETMNGWSCASLACLPPLSPLCPPAPSGARTQADASCRRRPRRSVSQPRWVVPQHADPASRHRCPQEPRRVSAVFGDAPRPQIVRAWAAGLGPCGSSNAPSSPVRLLSGPSGLPRPDPLWQSGRLEGGGGGMPAGRHVTPGICEEDRKHAKYITQIWGEGRNLGISQRLGLRRCCTGRDMGSLTVDHISRDLLYNPPTYPLGQPDVVSA